MAGAYIVGAVRTAGGRRNGKLKDWHPVDLAALVLDEIVARTAADPALIEDVIFGCVSSQITDGAAAVLVANEAGLAKLGATPRARVAAMALAGDDPVMMLAAPIPATEKLLRRAGVTIDRVDRYEVNEAFASVPMAWLHDVGGDPEKLNANGGAIALGHPLGCTGAKLMTTLLHELERTGGRYGLQTMCEGGGLANATLIERV
jgi:acetyl-CoA C-acetyltransferase